MNKLTKQIGCSLLILAIEFGCQQSSSNKKSKLVNSREIIVPFNNESISLISLIAKPEKYNQRKVRVKGFLNLEFEGDAIYLHKLDYELGIEKNGLWIDIDARQIDSIKKKSCNQHYVILEGVFEMQNKGHENAYSGAISKISRIEPLR
jgi:hypothetical protein